MMWDDMILIFSSSLLLAGGKSVSDNFKLHEWLNILRVKM